MTLHHSPGKTNCLTYTPKNINLTYNAGVYTVHSGSIITVPYGGGTALKVGDTIGSYYEVVRVAGAYIQLKLLKDYSDTFGGATSVLYFLSLGFTASGSMYWAGVTVSACTSGSTDSQASNSDGALYFDTTNHVIYRRYSNGTIGYQYGGGTNGVWISLPIAFHYGTPTKAEQVFDWCGYIGSTTFVLPGVKFLAPNGFNSDGTYKNEEWESKYVSTQTTTTSYSNQPLVIQNVNTSYYVNYLGELTTTPAVQQYKGYYNKKENKNYFASTTDKWEQRFFVPCALTSRTTNGVVTSLTSYSVKTTNDSVKIKDTGAYGVYFCPGKTNCLTYTPKNVNLTLSNGTLTLKAGSKVYVPNGYDINAGIVGSPTINNGVVSGFSTSNYLLTQNSVNLNSVNNFEIVVRAQHNTGSLLQQHSNAPYTIALRADLMLVRLSGDSGWTTVYNNTTGLITGNWYSFRASFDGSTYKFERAEDGGEYVVLATLKNSTKIISNNQPFILGTNDVHTDPYLGSIDLTQSYIKINGELWWQGKAGSGKPKFDEVVIGSDIVDADFGNDQREVAFLMTKNTTAQFSVWPNTIVVSGTSAPDFSSTGYWGVWYDTANNIIKIQDGTNEWKTLYGFSLPFCLVSSSSSAVTSIDQVFDWCGYIGSTAFVLPGVKGLIPNSWNSDGTYKSVEYTVPRVLTGYHGGQINATLTVDIGRDYLSFWNISSVHTVSSLPAISSTDYSKCYLTTENKQYYHAGTEFDGWREFYEIMPNTRMVTDSNGKITSLTPCSVKTTNDLQAINAIYNGSQLVYQYLPTGKTFNPSGSFQTYVVPKGVKKLQVDCVAAKGNGNGYGGRVQCVLSVTPGQTLYLAVGSANTGREIPTYNASDIRTNGNGITDTTSLQSRLVVAGGGGNTGNQAGSGGHGGGLTGAAGSDVDGKSGQGGTQSAGGAGGANGYWGSPGSAGGFGLGGRGDTYNVGGCGGAGWYGGGGGGSSAYGATLGGNGGGGSSYTNSSLCTNVSHTQGYRNGNGYITLTPIR